MGGVEAQRALHCATVTSSRKAASIGLACNEQSAKGRVKGAVIGPLRWDLWGTDGVHDAGAVEAAFGIASALGRFLPRPDRDAPARNG